jgi:hypothetical protein
MTKRTSYISAVADPERFAVGGPFDGVPSVASFQSSPRTDKPFLISAVSETDKTRRLITVALTHKEAAKLVSDFQSFYPVAERGY